MSHQADWNEEEGNFNLALSQRTEELYRVPNLEPGEDGLIEAPVLPLRDLVVFPRTVSPIFVGRESSLLAVQDAQARNQTLIGCGLGMISTIPRLRFGKHVAAGTAVRRVAASLMRM